jgi:uncharacterized membrane protein
MTIALPTKRTPWPQYAVPVWALLWIVSLVVAGDGGPALMAFGLAVPVVVLALWIWVVAGREDVEVDGGTLTLRRHVGPITSRRRFRASEVRDVRALEQREGLAERLGVPTAALALEHDGRTVCFGSGLDEAEAAALAGRIGEALRA